MHHHRRQTQDLGIARSVNANCPRAAICHPAQRGAREPPVERLGEDEHDAPRRGLQALAGRRLGADVGGMAIRARRPREHDQQRSGEREEPAHPAESKRGSDLAIAHTRYPALQLATQATSATVTMTRAIGLK